ncbi:MAG: hypothetical protein IT581_20080 [Verrucomicrobiales bacterium]|nr:hypothetical protein [Verrucomicrobiales bacterium]
MAVLNQFPKSRLRVWDAEFLSRLRRLGIVVFENRDGIDLTIGETGVRIHAERHRSHTTKASFYGENTDVRRLFGSTSLWFAVSRELKWHLDKTTDPGQRLALMAVIATL